MRDYRVDLEPHMDAFVKKRSRIGQSNLVKALASLMIFASVACTSERTRSLHVVDNHWDFLDENLDSENRDQCDLIYTSQLLEVAERQSFHQRSVNGIVTGPIKIRCLRRITNANAIKLQAQQGDPIASLLNIGEIYKSKSDFCNNVDRVVATLMNIYEHKDIYNGREVRRVPEAYYLVGAAKFECGQSGWEEFYAQAPSHGFDPAFRHNLAVD